MNCTEGVGFKNKLDFSLHLFWIVLSGNSEQMKPTFYMVFEDKLPVGDVAD